MTPPLPHRHQVKGAALSDDGRWLATTGFDELARVWDVRDPAAPAWADPAEGPGVVSPSGKQIVVWNPDEERFLTRDRATGAAVGRAIHASDLPGEGLSVSEVMNRGRIVLQGAETVVLADLERGTVIATWPCPAESGCRAVSHDPDGLLYVGAPGGLRAVDLITGAFAGPLIATGPVVDLVFGSDGRSILVQGREGSRLWDLETATPSSTSLPFFRRVAVGREWIAGLPTEGALKEFAGTDVVVYAPDGSKELRRLAHDAALRSIAAAPDGRRVATGTTAGDLFIWDATTGERLIGPIRSGPSPDDIEWSDDGRFLLDEQAFRPWCLFDTETGEFVAQGEDPEGWRRPLTHAGNLFHFEPLSDERSAEDWRLMAAALAVQVVGKDGSRWLPPDEVLAAWTTLAERYPEDFTARAQ